MAPASAVTDAQKVLHHKSVPPGQLALYKALYAASLAGLSRADLATAMLRTKKKLGGVLLALDGRIKKTANLMTPNPDQRLLIGRRYDETEEQIYYWMTDALRAAIDQEQEFRDHITSHDMQDFRPGSDEFSWP
jgi:hypothetical protein